MTMKSSFCEDLVDACEGQIDFKSYDGDSYCEKHVDDDTLWSYPIDPEGGVCCTRRVVVIMYRWLNSHGDGGEHPSCFLYWGFGPDHGYEILYRRSD